jgi:uncharacterized protein YndB with AHSA1/START domain
MPRPLVVEQHVPAPPERVYAAWMSAENLAQWWWPHTPDTVYEIDARVGGKYEIRSDAVGIGAQGEYLELNPPNDFLMTWRWMTDGRWEVEETVRAELAQEDGGTAVTLTHFLDDIVADGESLHEGWEDVMARLPAACV